jgi:hypothetical protein
MSTLQVAEEVHDPTKTENRDADSSLGVPVAPVRSALVVVEEEERPDPALRVL